MTTAPLTFMHELDAAKFLLAECTHHLDRHGVNYVIVGGWSAYLFHSSKFGHPGTFDVDVLLHADSLDDGSFDRAAEALLSSGYLRAPKNIFQAHRVLRIRNEEMVFHVDFLNERDPGNTLEIVDGSGRMKSIYTKAMSAVFFDGNYRSHLDFPNIRFPSPETFIVTKAAATLVMKRQRDAFDVFVTAYDQDLEAFRKLWLERCGSDNLFSDANDALKKALEEGRAVQKIQGVINQLRDSGHTTVAVPSEAEIRGTFRFLTAA